jgi:hypothetical protein
MQPTDPLRTGLSTGYVQRCRRRIYPDDLDSAASQNAGEGARAAADVEHAAGTELSCHRQVVVQIDALSLR